MQRLIFGCYTLLALTCSQLAWGAEIDTRPLNVRCVAAFPQLQWPDWLTGADEGLNREVLPVAITGAQDGTNRLFIASQHGSIHVMPNDPQAKSVSTFLDIRDHVLYDPKQNEKGLLGLAFHPQYKTNGEFFVYYSKGPKEAGQHTSIVSRFRVSKTDPNVADPNSEEVLLSIPQPHWNHNGGTVEFGPDGYLYICLGDGGAANDPHMNGQNLQSLLASILRIDVDRKDEGLQYGIPADNPFAGQKMARQEIWAYGLRNVWRLSFDRKTGTCWAADVGQDLWEEINIIQRGGNYGWNLREGRHSFGPGGVEKQDRLIDPIWEYDHEVGKSIIGGSVYRGTRTPQLQGAYLYADYVAGQVCALWYDEDSGQVTANRIIRKNGIPVITFGEDDLGEIYFSTRQGDILTFESP